MRLMTSKRLVWWLALLALVLIGCGGGSVAAKNAAYHGGAGPEYETSAAREPGFEDSSKEEAPGAAPSPAPVGAVQNFRSAPQQMGPMAQAAPAATGTSQPQPPQIATDASPIRQMLIYTARLTMAVFEVEKALNGVEQTARDVGGFLGRRTDREITIRVPVARFHDVMKKLEGSGDVLHREVQVEDVSEQFMDLSLRLKNARAVRDRIAQHLNDAKNVQEALSVERELERLSGEIERLEGRLKYLRDRAAYSTITVTFEPLRQEEIRRDRIFQLPFPWLSQLGLGRLMSLQ